MRGVIGWERNDKLIPSSFTLIGSHCGEGACSGTSVFGNLDFEKEIHGI